jgi:hypothetical protein
LFSAIASLLVLWQFYLLIYNPIQQLPTQQDREAGDRFIQLLKSLDGQVLVFNHGYYSTLAGKAPFFSSTPFSDVVSGVRTPFSNNYLWRRKIAEDLYNQILQSRSIDYVIVDNRPEAWQPYYLIVNNNVIDSDAFYPVTGARTRPQFLLIPNPVAEGGEFPIDSLKYRYLFNPYQEFDQDSDWIITQEPDSLSIALSQKYNYTLEIRAQPLCSNGIANSSLKVDVSWDNNRLGVLSFNSCDPQKFMFGLPNSMVTGAIQKLTFEIQSDSLSGENTSSQETGILRIMELNWAK